jgi:hypothetical protein
MEIITFSPHARFPPPTYFTVDCIRGPGNYLPGIKISFGSMIHPQKYAVEK